MSGWATMSTIEGMVGNAPDLSDCEWYWHDICNELNNHHHVLEDVELYWHAEYNKLNHAVEDEDC